MVVMTHFLLTWEFKFPCLIPDFVRCPTHAAGESQQLEGQAGKQATNSTLRSYIVVVNMSYKSHEVMALLMVKRLKTYKEHLPSISKSFGHSWQSQSFKL